nr:MULTISPECIES: hypothetical protein [unclassified Streptomyces]
MITTAAAVGVTAAGTAPATAAGPPPARAAVSAVRGPAQAPPGYGFDGSAERVRGAASSSDAVALSTGRTYRDTLRKDGRVYYRVDLDAELNAYVSVVAVPKAGGRVEYGDGFEVSLQDGSGVECGAQRARFSSAEYPRPLAAYARRTLDGTGSTCRQAGAYYVLVERQSKPGSSPDDWDLELRYTTEPGLRKAGPAELPEVWPSGTPAPPAGGPRGRQGGSGIVDAVSLGEGEWRADIRPGQTLFYRVPVDWGQQLFAGAELGSGATGKKYIGNALVLSLENPALGHVADRTVSYDGKPSTLALAPLRPVAHENRTSYAEDTGGMRFAGWYYLAATLNPAVGQEYGEGTVPLTLRIVLRGQAGPGPGYVADPGPFAVTAADRKAAEEGAAGSAGETAAAGRSGPMRALAATGLGGGTLLLLWLGGWTVRARRGARARA